METFSVKIQVSNIADEGNSRRLGAIPLENIDLPVDPAGQRFMPDRESLLPYMVRLTLDTSCAPVPDVPSGLMAAA